MAVDLSSMVTPILTNVPGWVVAVLATFASLMIVAVTVFAAGAVLGAVRGQKFIGGQFWDKDVYEAAMQDLHQTKRQGGLLDAEANNALREYKGELFHRRSRRW